MSVQFTDNSMRVRAALNDAVIAGLYEAAGEVESEVKRNTRVDTGQTRDAWQYKVDESKGEAIIGNPLENAIWEEFGTGEYAVNGDGRRGGWFYTDRKGETHFTKGKYPTRALQNAFESKKATVERIIQSKIQEDMG